MMFDSGGVLTGPIGGRWNPRYDFEAIVMAHAPDTPTDRFPDAIAAGDRFLASGATTPARSEYHRTMLRELGMPQPSLPLLNELEAPAAGPVLKLFPDVLRTLDQLRQWDVRMCVVSDNWAAGMAEMFAELGIAHYFEEFVISEDLGCNKPDPRMYEAGRRCLDLPADRCLFIDDDPALAQAAADLGFQAVTLDRSLTSPPTESVIASLDDLVALVRR
ncbi:hypothetical protein GCM10027456_65650 [Kineosporia babensis]